MPTMSQHHQYYNQKDHIETIVFTPDQFMSCYSSSSSSSCNNDDDDNVNYARPSAIQERVLSYENVDDLSRKLHDMYCSTATSVVRKSSLELLDASSASREQQQQQQEKEENIKEFEGWNYGKYKHKNVATNKKKPTISVIPDPPIIKPSANDESSNNNATRNRQLDGRLKRRWRRKIAFPKLSRPSLVLRQPSSE